ncbi:MAG: ribonuclease HII [Saprospiraceae bacterium]
MNLKTYYKNILYEAGCDEAGRGPLAGPVFAAAVILDPNQEILGLNDSKKLNEKERNILRTEIESKALCWSVCKLEPIEIDQINILQASLKAMRICLLDLKIRPTSIIIDGNKKIPHLEIEQYCIVKGDAKFQSIAAASILAKTHRDQYMLEIHQEFPLYGWNQNKGYPTLKHRMAIQQFGICKYHRKSFQMKDVHPHLCES